VTNIFNAICQFGESPALISEISLGKFFRQMGHPPSKKEVQALIRRADLDGDLKIGPQEFIEIIEPAKINKHKRIKTSPKREPLFLDEDKPSVAK
jgi:Ca2+-binding EF-hand superfamily protein